MSKNLIKKLFLVIVFVLVFAVSSCSEKPEDPNTPTDTPVTPVVPEKVVKISLTTSAETIKEDETVDLTVVVEGTDDLTYTYTVSNDNLVQITNDKLTIKTTPTIDTIVTITATSNADKTKKASKTIKVIAPVIEGQVGELTSDMITEIGDASVTLTGVVQDIYIDYNSSDNNKQTSYNYTVEMEEGKWKGVWYAEGLEGNKVTNAYRKGADEVTNANGITGHSVEQSFINKNNEVEVKKVTDTTSTPSVWETQHLWNHLGNLNVNKFEYDAENEVYEYKLTPSNTDELYFMTYLSVSLTPMLSDTFVKLYLKVSNGKVTTLMAQTDSVLYGADPENPDAISYTTVSMDFSKIGTTEVKDPEAYDAPLYADLLTKALENMKKAESYTFKAQDFTTYSPEMNPDDYETSTMSVAKNPFGFRGKKVQNNTSSVGVVGTVGRITKDAALFAETSKYSFSISGEDYKTEYFGYKQNDQNSFDKFEYQKAKDTLVGIRRYNGNFKSVLPQFDFSAGIFEYMGQTMEAGKLVHKFVLRSTEITRTIAQEISCYQYANCAESSVSKILTITVDDEGNLVSTTYPYSITQGTYLGFVKTTYLNVNKTTLDADLFDGYIPREVKTTWEHYMMQSYSPSHGANQIEVTAAVALSQAFGDKAAAIPSPKLFTDILGDALNGPFFEWEKVDEDENGKAIYHPTFSINAQSTEYDENSTITNYDELMDQFEEALTKVGYKISLANSTTTNPLNRYVTFVNGDITIVFFNNGTKNIFIDFYITGDWTLER